MRKQKKKTKIREIACCKRKHIFLLRKKALDNRRRSEKKNCNFASKDRKIDVFYYS